MRKRLEAEQAEGAGEKGPLDDVVAKQMVEAVIDGDRDGRDAQGCL